MNMKNGKFRLKFRQSLSKKVPLMGNVANRIQKLEPKSSPIPARLSDKLPYMDAQTPENAGDASKLLI